MTFPWFIWGRELPTSVHLTSFSFSRLFFKQAIPVSLDDSFHAVIIFVTLFWTLILQCPFELVMACAECNILDETAPLFYINHAISSPSPSCRIFILTICCFFRAPGHWLVLHTKCLPSHSGCFLPADMVNLKPYKLSAYYSLLLMWINIIYHCLLAYLD